MIYYGYASPTGYGVIKDYSWIVEMRYKIPYFSYRGFSDEDQAWRFVATKRKMYEINKIEKYGNIFSSLHLTVSYIIYSDMIYFNINTEKIGYVRFNDKIQVPMDIEYGASLVKCKVYISNMSNDSIYSHAIIIGHLLDIVGPFLDIELIVDSIALLYYINSYTGKKYALKKTIDKISSRIGHIAVTVKT